MTATSASGRLVVSDGSVDPTVSRPLRMASCVPAMAIGLVAPAAVMVLLEPLSPRLLYILPGLLLPFLAITVAIFIYCVLVPGDVVALSTEPEDRTLTIVEANLFARRHTVLEFSEVSDVRFANAYDQDGYGTRRAELLLRSGDHVSLPAWVHQADVDALKAAISTGRTRR